MSNDERTPSGKKNRTLAADSGSYALTGQTTRFLALGRTARALAKSRFDDSRWPLDCVLAWIAIRRIEALALSYQELDLRRHAWLRAFEDAEPLFREDPVRELWTKLTAGELEAIGPDDKPLPAPSWDNRSLDPKTWPDVRFRREDALRLWPSIEALAAECGERAGAPAKTKAGEEVGAPLKAKGRKAPRARRPSLAERLAAELRQMLPDGRGAKKTKEIEKDLRARPGVGNFGDTTFKKAMRLAFG
jgi:hypothetical protein